MALHDVQVLREVVKKLVPMIAGRGVRVTQMGAQAFVAHDPRTGKIERVNIPHIPDDADDGLILAVQGFIDHEVGHILDTDWKAVAEGKVVGCEIADEQKIDRNVAIGRMMNLANIVEDPFVERCMQKRFPGVAWNLDKLYGIFVNRLTKKALEEAKTDADRFGVLLVPIIRSIAGQKFFTDFLDAGKHWDEPLVKAFMDRVSEPLRKEIRTVKTSWDSLDIARQLYNILHPAPPIVPEPPAAKPAKDPEEGKDTSSGESEKPGEGKGSSDKPEEADDKGSGGEMSETPPESPPTEEADDEPPAEPESEEEESDDTPESEGDGDADEGGEDPDADPAPDADDETGKVPPPADEDVPETEAGHDGEPEEETKGEGEDDKEVEAGSKTAPGGEGEDEESDAEGGKDVAEDKPEGEAEKEEEVESSPFSMTEIPDSKDLAEAISDMITDEATRETRDADYRIYTSDWDVIEPLEVGSTYDPAWIAQLDSKTRHMVAPMQKEIERMMAARSQIVNTPGFRSGRLHSGSLHRLRVNDDRVFRRKQENHSTATAVSLVIDNSGSMNGGKTRTSMAAAYALSQTLERVGIKHEVIGFTTKNLTSKQATELHTEEARIGTTFSRTEIIYMPIYKTFDERLNADVRSRFAKTFGYADFLKNNIDGESVAVACRRLMLQREPRRVMLVFSDGQPACYSERPRDLYSSLHKAIADAKRMKIELIGIGLEDDTVKTFYPKYVVLEDVEQLPKVVMGELRRILLTQNK